MCRYNLDYMEISQIEIIYNHMFMHIVNIYMHQYYEQMASLLMIVNILHYLSYYNVKCTELPSTDFNDMSCEQ